MSTWDFSTFLRVSWLFFRTEYGGLPFWAVVMEKAITPFLTLVFLWLVAWAKGGTWTELSLAKTALLISANTALFSLSFSFVRERTGQTLRSLVTSPQPLWVIFAAKSACLFVEGFLLTAVALAVALLFMGATWDMHRAFFLLCDAAFCGFSAMAFALCFASVNLRWRQAIVIVNICWSLLVYFSGSHFPLADLPFGLGYVRHAFPFAFGIEALAEMWNAPNAHAWLMCGFEVLVGVFWLLVGLKLLRILEGKARRQGTLDMA